MGRNRRRSNRSNVKTLPTKKTHRYWARHRGPRIDRFRYFPDVEDTEGDIWPNVLSVDLYDPPYKPNWDDFRRSSIWPIRISRNEWKIRELKRLQRQAVRLSPNVNFNRPTLPSPARYRPDRMFDLGVVAAAAPAAGQDQEETPVCVERQVRKEVMFATGKAGRVGQKSPVWTRKSRVRCK